MRANPYTPGAGFMPAYLAGRETLIENAEKYIANIKNRFPQQSVIYYGLRGVGKTVLLNRIETIADDQDILYVHIEAKESSTSKDHENNTFTNKLLNALYKFVREISMKEKAKSLVRKCMISVKSFSLTYNPTEGSFTMELDRDTPVVGGNYADDLTDLFVQLGKLAIQSDDTICIFIDEVQYLTEREQGGLIAAIHRCNQLRLPVMIFCAGLPKILRTVGEAYSYAERLFRFEKIDALNAVDAEKAIAEPAKPFQVEYTIDAIQRIIETTGGYPYFIQQLCDNVWECCADTNSIDIHDVISVEQEFFRALDTGFFAVRYDRCTHSEKSFMTAMVKCGELPCTISNVAKILKRSAKSISPLRAQLISKGMIYPTAHGEIDFTVPQFDNFIRRINPNLVI